MIIRTSITPHYIKLKASVDGGCQAKLCCYASQIPWWIVGNAAYLNSNFRWAHIVPIMVQYVPPAEQYGSALGQQVGGHTLIRGAENYITDWKRHVLCFCFT